MWNIVEDSLVPFVHLSCGMLSMPPFQCPWLVEGIPAQSCRLLTQTCLAFSCPGEFSPHHLMPPELTYLWDEHTILPSTNRGSATAAWTYFILPTASPNANSHIYWPPLVRCWDSLAVNEALFLNSLETFKLCTAVDSLLRNDGISLATKYGRAVNSGLRGDPSNWNSTIGDSNRPVLPKKKKSVKE